MNPNAAESTDKYSPQAQLTGFTNSKFALWLGAALIIHVLVIGALSMGYIRDTWIDPEGAKARKEAMAAAAKAEAEKNAPKPPAPAATATNAVAPATNAAPTTAAPATNTLAGIPDERKNTAVVKEITAVAPTNEIPKSPDDLGLSIKDTNVR
jgi:hypothetical protein